jgi:sulfonate transport system substrate-binding protein
VLKVSYDKLDETGQWVKTHPKDAAALLADSWHINAATIGGENSHRSCKAGPVAKEGLAEQNKISDAFFAEACSRAKSTVRDDLAALSGRRRPYPPR